VTRLFRGNVVCFRNLAIPLWFIWANKDKDAARFLMLQIDVMQNPSVVHLTPTTSKDGTLPV